jgi:regulatory protein
MTDDQRRSRGVLEGGTPGLATVHDLFSGRAAGKGGGQKSGAQKSGAGAQGEEAAPVVSLDGTRLNRHDLRDMIAQKEAEWRAGQETDGVQTNGAPKGAAPGEELAQPAWSTPGWGEGSSPASRSPQPDVQAPEAKRKRGGGEGESTPRRARADARRGPGLSRKPRKGSFGRGQEAADSVGEAGDHERPPRTPEELTEDAREILLKQLSAGPRTRSQLAKTLAQKDIPDEVAAAVLDRFEEVDLVDDAAFSKQYVENRHSGRGLARRALAYELRQKGVADETVREAVDSVSTDDELATARQLVRKKAASMTKDDPERRMRRLAGMLARKGYGSGVAYQAIREELADLDAEGQFGHPDFD